MRQKQAGGGGRLAAAQQERVVSPRAAPQRMWSDAQCRRCRSRHIHLRPATMSKHIRRTYVEKCHCVDEALIARKKRKAATQITKRVQHRPLHLCLAHISIRPRRPEEIKHSRDQKRIIEVEAVIVPPFGRQQGRGDAWRAAPRRAARRCFAAFLSAAAAAPT